MALSTRPPSALPSRAELLQQQQGQHQTIDGLKAWSE